MTSIPLSVRNEPHPQLRPLNILRDLPAVADLIELCFADTMDHDGKRYVQDMRRAGRDDSFLRWATRMAESTSLPLTGYVWEEDGRLVGNASLVPFRDRGRKIYLIANVAVHPDYRRRGIARLLTERALKHAAERKVRSIWLHVRDDNPAAIRLYSQLGFRERARRTTWEINREPPVYAPRGVTVIDRLPEHWPQQQQWLRRTYPDSLAWYRPSNFSALQPGLLNWLYRLFIDLNVRQWSALSGPERQLEAVAAWIPAGSNSYGLWLATRPQPNPDAVTDLLIHARLRLARFDVSFDHPAGEVPEAIRAAGFGELRTLIWMEYTRATF
ncbi:MAG: N-acetyltransferase family protein [Bacteroidota bacterium]